jgi:two-component system, chemotaxis family, chemotaxis protein CheY
MAKTILVVDDSVTMVMSLKSTLSMGGFQVETANNGQQALDKLKGGVKPDLILTDINMPVMGGLEMIGKVRALARLPILPDSDA